MSVRGSRAELLLGECNQLPIHSAVDSAGRSMVSKRSLHGARCRGHTALQCMFVAVGQGAACFRTVLADFAGQSRNSSDAQNESSTVAGQAVPVAHARQKVCHRPRCVLIHSLCHTRCDLFLSPSSQLTPITRHRQHAASGVVAVCSDGWLRFFWNASVPRRAHSCPSIRLS